MATKNQPRFVNYEDDDLEDFLKEKRSKNTNSATKNAMTLLQTFCAETQQRTDLLCMTAEELDKVLQKFYTGVRKPNGEFYKVTTLNGFRFAFQRHFIEKTGMNIILDRQFDRSNICFKNVLAMVKKAGKGTIDHYPEIEQEDIKKLYASFDINTPSGLQDKVWFDIMFQLCRRGRENLRDMTKNTFYVSQDATGKQFLYQVTSEMDKNHGITDASFDTNGEGRIYETKDHNCPVQSFIKYLNHLHPIQNALWQRPRENIKPTDTIWYCSAPMGEKKLGSMMPKLSEKYGLSERYTNHSIRVTSLQVLEDKNIEGRHIIRISGHKSTASVQNYARRLSASRKRNISACFANHLSSPGPESDKENDCNIANNNDKNSNNYNNNISGIQQRSSISAQNLSMQMSSSPSTTFCSTIPSKSSDEGNNSKNLVDIGENDVDDVTLSRVPAELLNSFNSFNNCNNCTFNFHVHMHQK